ncbi:hypothetical protein [Streptomyces sp. B1-3]|uniref:hypothetical protein n=1 Tax=Streptomyces sp. B1-3 TaxID=3141453 RepID=UPI003D2A2E1D
MASHIERRWLDTGSGPGAMVDVIVYDAESPDQAAYRRLIAHSSACQTCRQLDENGWATSTCETAQRLYRVWRRLWRPLTAAAATASPEGSPTT